MALFDGVDACASPVLSTAEVARSPLMERVRRSGDGEADGEADLIRSPARTRGVELRAAGEGAEVLERFGFSAEEIEGLVSSGALGDGD